MPIRKATDTLSAGARVVVLLLGLWFAATAQAHDPGLSAASLQLQRGQLIATLNFAPADAAGLDAGALEVQVDGRAIVPAKARVTGATTSDVQLQANYVLPAGRTLTIRSTRLGNLARGHRQYCVVTDEHGRTLVTRLLDAHADSLQLDLATVATTASPSAFGQFLRHGIVHILTGYDHLLFITALALAAVTFWDLLKVVGMFTLAHSVTLTLSVFNIVRLPPRVVEPLIAASIVFVAVTNIFWPKRSRGWTRLGVAFFFGLFHGLGFAGGLLDAMSGMAGVAVGVAIVAFSLGVELGHQMIVLPLFFGLRIARATRDSDAVRDRWSLGALRYGSACISVAGAFYLFAALR
jgi:HupE / UreJ protein